MNIEEIRAYCLSKKGVSESLPFDETSLVFKVAGKMFALLSTDKHLFMNLKCDPEKAMSLREQYVAVTPGYHMNKKHWNSIELDDSISSKLLKEWIDDSYLLVVESLPKKLQKNLLISS